jgi:hypothetical protein
VATNTSWSEADSRLASHLLQAGRDGTFLGDIAETLETDRHSAWLLVTLFEHAGYACSIIVHPDWASKSGAVLYRPTQRTGEILSG